MPSFLDQVRGINGSRWCESIAGGPNTDFTVPILGIIGAMYPYLENDQQREGLVRCLDYLDGINCLYSQNHVQRIDEPWLVRDIIISRPAYWCGYEQYTALLKEHPAWADFSKRIDTADSEFWLAIAVTRHKYSSLEVRTRFYKNFPELTDRTLDAIAGITFEESRRCHEGCKKTLEEDIADSMAMYDPLLHRDIYQKMGEKNWILLAEPRI